MSGGWIVVGSVRVRAARSLEARAALDRLGRALGDVERHAAAIRQAAVAGRWVPLGDVVALGAALGDAAAAAATLADCARVP